MRKLRIALMATIVMTGGFLLGSIVTFELQPPEVITKTVEAVSPPPARIEISPIVLVNIMERTFESTTFSMKLTLDEVKAGKCDGNAWQDFWFRDCLLMKVPAEIKAGFGKEILDPSRFTSTTDTLTVDLGKPVIYRPNIIHDRVKVLNPKDDGGYWSDPDKNLQAKGFVDAEKRLQAAACQAHILKSAALSAEKQYGDLFRNALKTAGDLRTVKIVYDIPDCKDVL
jgi:Protein of unknown function (DUF4230)